MIAKIKARFQNFLLKNGLTSNFYSQGGEDAILYGIFYKKIKKGEKGFFVDVGAYHPILYSNSYFFYRLGWKGINIDACPGSMKAFNKKRPRDINLEIGIDKVAGDSTFYILENKSTMNTFSEAHLKYYNRGKLVKRKVTVETNTLQQVLDKHSRNFKEIDFLNVDVEGMDQRVLESNNWQRYKPKVIVVEIRCKDLDDVKEQVTSLYLTDLGYKIVAKNLLKKDLASVFYVLNNFHY